ncbi:MAG: alpha/beta fold hydrolase [Desulfobacteraceae bacterium]|jgi:esterase/lipase/1-acyl-sn-glycerol-3-phosphate acyltransferase
MINSIAYRTTGLAIKTLSNLSKARVTLHGQEHIPQGSKIFVINHFTRLETFMMPYYLHKLLDLPVWSLAASDLFVGAFGRYLQSVGAVSTDHPDRDRLIVKSLLTGEAGWIIFPEGRMVKSKKIVEKGRYIVSYAGGKHPPHTGAAFLALRTEFYRQRMLKLSDSSPEETQRLLPMFNLESLEQISRLGTFIVPVNITYFPVRARMNIINQLAARLVDDLPERFTEELMTEGAMLLSGVDMDIRFGEPIDIGPYLQKKPIIKDLQSPRTFGFDDALPCLKSMRHAALKIMQRYMEAIYGMTTVNHDHIFASLLKHSPRSRIRKQNFKNRAFLAITQETAHLPIHLHRNLSEDQIPLLIDDAHLFLRDFISVARESDVLMPYFQDWMRRRHKLSRIFDFHRARIDNPVAVIANEVEPLTALQKKISRLSWMPASMIRSRLVWHFKEAAQREFERDYKDYAIADESKPRRIGAPVLLKGRNAKIGIVICHGYMAAPEEVRLLGEFLNQKGYWIYMPRLKGHGTAPEDLAQRSYREWIRSIEQGYLLIRNRCRRVVLGGFSTGAALALELASRIDSLAGVFAVSTPLRLQYLSSKFAPFVDTWNKLMERVHFDDARMDFVENQPENPHINYLRNPISGVRELERLMDYVEPKLADIKVPALVIQSQEDPVVNPKGSERIFQLLGTEDKQYLLFNYKRHGILRGPGSERVFRAIATFIEQLPPTPALNVAKT